MQVKELVNIEALVAKVKEITKKVREGETVKFSEKAKKAIEIIKKEDFGCYKSGVVKIVELFLEEDISFEALNYKYPLGCMVVPLSKGGGHNYPINKPCLVCYRGGINEYQAINYNGVVGNYLPLRIKEKTIIRYATEKEIEEFFDLYNYEKGFVKISELITGLASCQS